MTINKVVRSCAFVLFLALGAGGAGAADSAVSPPRATAHLGVDADPGIQAWQVVSAIAYLAVLAGVGFALVRYSRQGFTVRFSKPGEGPIRALGSARVSPTVTVTLLEVDGRRVLVASGASATSMIEVRKDA